MDQSYKQRHLMKAAQYCKTTVHQIELLIQQLDIKESPPVSRLICDNFKCDKRHCDNQNVKKLNKG